MHAHVSSSYSTLGFPIIVSTPMQAYLKLFIPNFSSCTGCFRSLQFLFSCFCSEACWLESSESFICNLKKHLANRQVSQYTKTKALTEVTIGNETAIMFSLFAATVTVYCLYLLIY